MSRDIQDHFGSQIKQTVEKLDSVSPSFCLAKWLQVTLHLHTGETHSCHHPHRHKVDASSLPKDPSALHNTQQKMLARKEMLEGKRPSECDYCWSIEDADAENLSDRHIKSNDPWAAPHFEFVRKQIWNQTINPTYVEVNFTNTCNFKCGYCEPNISSSWMNEARQHGPFILGDLHHNGVKMREHEGVTLIENEDQNPYVQAFWEWWPNLIKDLHVFRVTGGEPLLSRNTFRAIEYLSNNPAPHLEFAINSNLGVPSRIVATLTQAIEPVLRERKIKSFEIYTSLDTFGKDAEYIRFGLDLDLFQRNVEHVLKNISGLKLVFMVTFNALSFPRFKEFLEYVMKLRRKIREEFKNGNEVLIDISFLRQPQFWAANFLTEDFYDDGEEILRFMLKSRIENHPQGFYSWEIDKMRRLLTWMRTPVDPRTRDLTRKRFFKFITEHDRRRGTDFLATFPRYEKFFALCETAAAQEGLR